MSELIPTGFEDELKLQNLSFEAAQRIRQESTWKELSSVTVGQALSYWLTTLKDHTSRNYSSAFRMLTAKHLIALGQSLQVFALVNHEKVIDEIKLQKDWQESTKQARAAAYISFTAFLQRRTQGIIRKAVSNKEGNNRTFFKVRDKVKTNPLTSSETVEFLDELLNINNRDALIAKLILQGGKRKGEVLALQIEDISFKKMQIRYRQSKTKGVIKETVIHYPAHVMDELEEYCRGRKGLCFVTRYGNAIAPYQIDRNFMKAGRRAGVNFPVTPHVLRVTLVTRLKERKIQDSEIMKITGHASPAQLLAYDRSDLADNPTANISLV